MGYSVLLTPAAEDDYQEIVAYLANQLEAHKTLRNFIVGFEEALKHLESYPQMFEASRVPNLQARGYRKFVVGKYVVLYLIQEEKQTVYIARIFHGSQNYQKYL